MALLPISDSVLSSVLSHYPVPDARVLRLLECSKRNDNFVIKDAFGHHSKWLRKSASWTGRVGRSGK